MKKILALFLIFIMGCSSYQQTKEIECSTDDDCAIGGCSGQLCGVKGKIENVITTCEYKEVYNCLKLTSCSCVDNKCQWKENNEYNECLDKF